MSAPDPTLDQKLLAIADPTRREILVRLANGEATVNELCAPFALSQPAISKHLKVLEAAGLISRRREGTKRPCAAVPAGLDAILNSVGLLKRAMEANYDRLDALWEALPDEDKTQARAASPSTTKPRAASVGRKKPSKNSGTIRRNHSKGN